METPNLTDKGESEANVAETFHPVAPAIPDPANQPSPPLTSTVQNRTLMGILSYLGILFLIPYLTEKNDRFIIFHAQQGMRLFVAEAVFSILSVVINIFLRLPGLRLIFAMISWTVSLLSFGFLILIIMGIVNVLNNRIRPLPIIGGQTNATNT